MSEAVKTWSEWLNNTRFSYTQEDQANQMLLLLNEIKDKILERAHLKPNDVFLDVGTGMGLLSFGAYEKLKGTGKVIASDAFADCIEECRKIAEKLGIENEIEFLQTDATDIKLPDSSADVITVRSVLVHLLDKPKAINEFFRVLKPGGRISAYEAIMSRTTKFYEFINPCNFPGYEKLKETEDKIMSDENDPLMNFNENSLRKNLEDAGFKNIDIIPAEQFSACQLSKETVDFWLNAPLSVGQPTLREKYLRYFSENELNEIIAVLKTELDEKPVILNLPKVYIYAEKH